LPRGLPLKHFMNRDGFDVPRIASVHLFNRVLD